jgi:hypothetical protein
MNLFASRWSRFAVLAVAALSLSWGRADAGEIADRAAEADSLIAVGKPAEALTAFDKAAEAFWDASPLQFRVALLADEVSGFGAYKAHGDAPFKEGDKLTLYVEPVGFGTQQVGNDVRSALAADVEIHTPGGLVLAKAENFGGVEWTGKRREVHATVTVPLPKLKPGEYQLVVTFRDLYSPKTATETLPFTIAEDIEQ